MIAVDKLDDTGSRSALREQAKILQILYVYASHCRGMCMWHALRNDIVMSAPRIISCNVKTCSLSQY